MAVNNEVRWCFSHDWGCSAVIISSVLAAAEGGNVQKVTHSILSELMSQALCHYSPVFSFFSCFFFPMTAPLYIGRTCLVAWDHSSRYLWLLLSGGSCIVVIERLKRITEAFDCWSLAAALTAAAAAAAHSVHLSHPHKGKAVTRGVR